MELTEYHIEQIVKQTLIGCGLLKDEISHTEACVIFESRRKFENLVTKGKIKFIKGEGRNSKRIYSRLEVERLKHEQSKN